MAISPGTLGAVVRADHVAGPPQGRWMVDDLAALPALPVVVNDLFVADSL
ncbi:MAG: hypothetical protein IT340_20695 [Chloroflexi bacterium]|nr:hypothetical protein [Chloroflexota bacterium]